jgi:hypothetical protein
MGMTGLNLQRIRDEQLCFLYKITPTMIEKQLGVRDSIASILAPFGFGVGLSSRHLETRKVRGYPLEAGVIWLIVQVAGKDMPLARAPPSCAPNSQPDTFPWPRCGIAERNTSARCGQKQNSGARWEGGRWPSNGFGAARESPSCAPNALPDTFPWQQQQHLHARWEDHTTRRQGGPYGSPPNSRLPRSNPVQPLVLVHFTVTRCTRTVTCHTPHACNATARHGTPRHTTCSSLRLPSSPGEVTPRHRTGSPYAEQPPSIPGNRTSLQRTCE